MSLFTRKVGTCVHDDVCPKCPKGVASILANYQYAITFSEHGIQKYGVLDVNFDHMAENADRGMYEPKYYHFQSGETF